MAKSKADTTASTDPVAMGQDLMKQIEDAGLGPMRWLGAAWFEKMADMNGEVISFVADRIREDVKTQHALLHCKTTEEVQKTQVAFLEKAYAQYTEETGKLLKMSMDMLPTSNDETKNTPV
ncbi:phasin family protein [Yoonia sp. GPGPB17]|uniref:phasin family protein n=1 Tax=Yoonia sp. GPGPB17 TaxID=3026147 RepID=UPI0030BF72A6